MKTHKLNKGIEEARGLSLTPAEKQAIFERVMSARPAQPTKSPFWSFVRTYRSTSVLAGIFVAVLVGTSVVSASEKALPGSVLYPVKIHVVEQFQELLATTPEEHAQLQLEKASRRMEEAEMLAGEHRLDAKSEQEIKGLLEQHTEDFAKSVAEISATSSVRDLNTAFDAKLTAHARILDFIDDWHRTADSARTDVGEAFKKETKEWKTDRTREEKTIDDGDAYIVATTSATTTATTTVPASSEFRKRLFDRTHDTIERPVERLEEAVRESVASTTENARELLDAPKGLIRETSSVLEAGFKTDLRSRAEDSGRKEDGEEKTGLRDRLGL